MDFEKAVVSMRIYDWKTGKRNITDGKRQLKLYAHWFFNKYPALETLEAELVFLDVKTEKKDVFTITRDDSKKELEKISEKIQKIESFNSEHFYCQTTPLCGYCEFLNRCPAGQQALKAKEPVEVKETTITEIKNIFI
jgi:hypothetical protein